MESLIRKFVENKLSEDEIEQLQEYLKTPEGLICFGRVMDEHAADFDNAYLIKTKPDVAGAPAVTKRSRYPILRLAAAAFTGLAIMTGIYFYVASKYALTVYQTAAGQKTTITLPDQTIVILNANSSLSYRNNWNKEKRRTVTLSGEAYFKVTHDREKPFVVNTTDISIRVMGTTFNVKSYDEDESVETTLVEGKVLIEKQRDSSASPEVIELFPDQKATFSKNSNQIVLNEVKTETEAAWVKGSLIFDDEPFSEIVKDLERWYGAKILVKENASLRCRFNARIENESLEEVLKLFSSSGSMKYHIGEDNQVVIEGTLCDEAVR